MKARSGLGVEQPRVPGVVLGGVDARGAAAADEVAGALRRGRGGEGVTREPRGDTGGGGDELGRGDRVERIRVAQAPGGEAPVVGVRVAPVEREEAREERARGISFDVAQTRRQALGGGDRGGGVRVAERAAGEGVGVG